MENDSLFDKPDSYSVQDILSIMKSIKKVSLEDSGLETYFVDDPYPNSISSFIPGSFTRELLELIEKHLDKQADY